MDALEKLDLKLPLKNIYHAKNILLSTVEQIIWILEEVLSESSEGCPKDAKA